jgi:hypothetical protein
MTNTKQPETVFTLTIDAQEMSVRYQPNWTRGIAPYGFLQFRSPCEPRRRIPVSETGYRSYFAPMHEIEAAPSVEEYARAVALAIMARASGPTAEDADQLPLF